MIVFSFDQDLNQNLYLGNLFISFLQQVRQMLVEKAGQIFVTMKNGLGAMRFGHE